MWSKLGWGGQGIVAAGIEIAALPLEIWVASVEDFSHDLSAPDLTLSHVVEWTGTLPGK